MFVPRAALKSGRGLIGPAGFSNSEVLTTVQTTRFPAMQKEEFCFVYQVPTYAEFEIRSGNRCQKTKVG